MTATELYDHLKEFCEEDLLFQSRVHPLHGYINSRGANIFVKREDESAFGTSGSKRRKYASIFPWLKQGGFEKVALIGGAHSNHIVGMLQLLLERGIDYHLFLKESHTKIIGGNRLWLELLANPERITWITSKDWPQVNTIAQQAITQFSSKTCLLPEGGNCPAALPGAMTLLPDIVRNERELGIQFDHIFMDAGTGFIAAANLLSHSLLLHKSEIHIIKLAESPSTMVEELNSCREDLAQFGLSVGTIPPYTCTPSETARSFGSLNQTILQTIKTLARNHGLLTDPIYTAKLFYSAKVYIEREKMSGNILIVHSGGGNALMGFAEKFGKA